jgi:hypothetical protein
MMRRYNYPFAKLGPGAEQGIDDGALFRDISANNTGTDAAQSGGAGVAKRHSTVSTETQTGNDAYVENILIAYKYSAMYIVSVILAAVVLTLAILHRDEVRIANSFYEDRYTLQAHDGTELPLKIKASISIWNDTYSNITKFFQDNHCSDVYYDGKLIATESANRAPGINPVSVLCTCLSKAYNPNVDWYLTGNKPADVDSQIIAEKVKMCYETHTGPVVKSPCKHCKYNFVDNIVLCVCAVAIVSTPVLFIKDMNTGWGILFCGALNCGILVYCVVVVSDNFLNNTIVLLSFLIVLMFMYIGQAVLVWKIIDPSVRIVQPDLVGFDVITRFTDAVLFITSANSLIVYLMAMLHASNIREYSIIVSCCLLVYGAGFTAIVDLRSSNTMMYVVFFGILLLVAESCTTVLGAISVLISSWFILLPEFVDRESLQRDSLIRLYR